MLRRRCQDLWQLHLKRQFSTLISLLRCNLLSSQLRAAILSQWHSQDLCARCRLLEQLVQGLPQLDLLLLDHLPQLRLPSKALRWVAVAPWLLPALAHPSHLLPLVPLPLRREPIAEGKNRSLEQASNQSSSPYQNQKLLHELRACVLLA